LHTAIDRFSRLAYTEALPDVQARTAIAFTHRARAFFARHDIWHVHRIVTDNGACYRARDFATVLRGARHQRITPYTPRHNGKVERYHRILAEEFLYARAWTSEQHIHLDDGGQPAGLGGESPAAPGLPQGRPTRNQSTSAAGPNRAAPKPVIKV
jgi:transposase InsO family protein